ncbi:MAG: hypothetical protein AAF597_13510 [Bacteroidota bacterium]
MVSRHVSTKRSNYSIIRTAVILFALFVLFFSAGCQRDFGGTRLFTVTYPVLEFGIPAGQTTTFFLAQNRVPTGFFDALRDNNVDASDVDLVGGFRARITSLSGEDFGEIERVDVRACPVGTPNGCTDLTFNLFSLSDNFNRRQQQINLNPSPINARELFLGSDDFRFEIVIFPGQTTSVPIDARLEWEVQAVGDLE